MAGVSLNFGSISEEVINFRNIHLSYSVVSGRVFAFLVFVADISF